MKTLPLLLALSFICIPVLAFAQKGESGDEKDGPVGIFQSRQEYYEFMGNAKRAAYGEGGTAEMKAAINLLNDMVLNKPLGTSSEKYGGVTGSVGLLSNPKVREDLEMLDDQYEKLQQVHDRIQKRAAEQLRQIDFSNPKNMTVYIRKIRKEAEDGLEEALLPHQIKRLRQLDAQSRLRRRSLANLLTSEPYKTDLEITDDQSEELKKAEQEIETELAEKIAKLRLEARDELISKLKRKQREQVTELFGDAFEFEQNSKFKKPRRKKDK